MDIGTSCDKIFKFMKQTNYIVFLIVCIVLSSVIMIILTVLLDIVPNESYNIGEIFWRFIIGLPLLLQLLLAYIVYRKNRNRRIIRNLWRVTLLYTIVCGILSLYDLYFTQPSFGDDLIIGVLFSQILFQIAIIVTFVIWLFFKLVYREFIVKSVIILILSWILINGVNIYSGYSVVLIPILINCSNSLMLFILSNIAKEKVFKMKRYTEGK